MKKQFMIFAMIAMMSIPIIAHADTKINTISLKIETEQDDDTYGLPELEITAKGKNYSVDGYEITSETEEDSNYEDEDEGNGPGASIQTTTKSTTKKETVKSDEPITCEITLSAEDSYYFNTMAKKDIKINGFGANCTKAVRQNKGTTLVLTVELPELKNVVRMVDNAGWKDSNIASWDKSDNASGYEVKLYRDGKGVGKVYETSGTKFNFGPLMLREGSYSYTVRAKDSDGKNTKRTESDTTTITAEQAKQLKEKYGVIYEKVNAGEGPSADRKILNGGWQNDNGKYWYRLDDGMFPQNSWLQLGDNWYFFDSDGYMLQNEWKTWKGNEYYFGSDGIMLRNTRTPDGRKVDANGIAK